MLTKEWKTYSKAKARKLAQVNSAGGGQWRVSYWDDGYEAWCEGPTMQYFQAVESARALRYRYWSGTDNDPPKGWRC